MTSSSLGIIKHFLAILKHLIDLSRPIIKSASSILLGIGATLLCNCFYLSSSYLIKHKNVVPGEITVFSALLRFVIFGSWAAKIKCQQMSDTNQEQPRYSKRSWLFLIISNMAIAVAILLSYISVQLLPLSDFIVFAFISPVFTLIYTMLHNRQGHPNQNSWL